MPKLNDTQRSILAGAGARETGEILPFPKSLKLGTGKANSTIQAMIESGLILECPLADGESLWRTDDEAGKLTIVITSDGLRAVGIEPDQIEADRTRRETPRGKTWRKPATSRSASKSTSSRSVRAGAAGSATATPGSTTKLGLLVIALRLKKGATIKDMADATGWQSHSVRGAISGALKKKQGLDVTSSVVDGRGRVYRIAE